MNVTTLKFAGPTMFCPDCRRELVSCNPDGTFNIAGRAGISVTGEGFLAEDGFRQSSDALITQATCYRTMRRFKRWLRQHNPRRT